MIIHGNCVEVMETFKANSIDLILTDPPYTMSRESIEYIHTEFLRLSKCIIVFAKPENQWVEGARQILFWNKPISTKNTSKRYSRFVEMIFIYGENTWNPNRHWSQYTNVFTDLIESKLHPHQKPESLIRRLALNHTDPADIILDPFMGSGTTGVVCKTTGREFIGIEIDEDYFKIAEKQIASVKQQE